MDLERLAPRRPRTPCASRRGSTMSQACSSELVCLGWTPFGRADARDGAHVAIEVGAHHHIMTLRRGEVPVFRRALPWLMLGDL